jgi:hypothetical protein
MQAESVRPGLTLITIGAAAGALLFAFAAPRATTALPPVADPERASECASTTPAAEPAVVSDHARYVVVDLDHDGTSELVALGGSTQTPELVVVEAVNHGVLARIPFGTPGNSCASDFRVEDGMLTVDDYRMNLAQEATCELWRTHHYYLQGGTITEQPMPEIDF